MTLDQSRVSNRDSRADWREARQMPRQRHPEGEVAVRRRPSQHSQLTQIDGSSDGLLYDRAGNALQLPPDVEGNWNEHYQLTWDAWNRLVRIEDEGGTPVAAYGYSRGDWREPRQTARSAARRANPPGGGGFVNCPAADRRTTRVMGSETRHFYYSEQWKCVEERVESPSNSSSSSSSYSPISSSSSSSYSPYSSSSSSSYPYYSSESSYSFAALAGSGSSSSSSSYPAFSSNSSSSFHPYSSSSSSSSIPYGSSSSSSSSAAPTQAAVQYLWGVRPQHRDELIRRDRHTGGGPTLDERLYCLMDYYSPTAMVDTSGNVLERYRFSAFGLRTVMNDNWVEKSASSYEVRFGFQGQFLDTESGYYDYGYRYYSPSLGRWLNRDPIEEEGGVNLYAFVGNDAVNGVDRLGHFAEFIDCCKCQENALSEQMSIAQEQIEALKKVIDTTIKGGLGSDSARKLLKKSMSILNKAKQKLPKLKIECSCESPQNAIAKVPPWGSTVTIFRSYFDLTEEAQAATLVHEATHAASGLTDAVYWWQEEGFYPMLGRHGELFDLQGLPSRFHRIASTYDTWIIFGFVIPSEKEEKLPNKETRRSMEQCMEEIAEHCEGQ